MPARPRGVVLFALVLAACGGSQSPLLDEEPSTPSRSGSSGSASSGSNSGNSGQSGSASTGKSGAAKSGSSGVASTSGKSGSSGSVPDPATFELPDAPPADSPVARHGQLSVSGPQMLDGNGSPVQLRGVSSMWLNWETTGYAQNTDGLRWLRDNWKINLLRVATPIDLDGKLIAEGPRATYQKKLEVSIRIAAQLGIYVLVDLHSHHASDFPEVANAFFDDLSKKYGHLPNVIWETFNEPLKVSWSDVLKPYHEKVISTIRANDPDNIIVLGTPSWSQGVDEASLDQVTGTNIMYTLHFYSCTHGDWLMDRADAAWSRKMALFVTEWGATDADGGTKVKRVCSTEGVDATTGIGADAWHKWMNQAKISWAAWKFDDCNDSSCFFKPNAPVDGGWTDEWLQGQGPYVREKLLAP